MRSFIRCFRPSTRGQNKHSLLLYMSRLWRHNAHLFFRTITHWGHTRGPSMISESQMEKDYHSVMCDLYTMAILNGSQQDGQEVFVFTLVFAKLYRYHQFVSARSFPHRIPPFCHCPCPIDHSIVHYYFLCPHCCKILTYLARLSKFLLNSDDEPIHSLSPETTLVEGRGQRK